MAPADESTIWTITRCAEYEMAFPPIIHAFIRDEQQRARLFLVTMGPFDTAVVEPPAGLGRRKLPPIWTGQFAAAIGKRKTAQGRHGRQGIRVEGTAPRKPQRCNTQLAILWYTQIQEHCV